MPCDKCGEGVLLGAVVPLPGFVAAEQPVGIQAKCQPGEGRLGESLNSHVLVPCVGSVCWFRGPNTTLQWALWVVFKKRHCIKTSIPMRMTVNNCISEKIENMFCTSFESL